MSKPTEEGENGKQPAGLAEKSNRVYKILGMHYLLEKSIGEGTFGKVKLATHLLSGEKVAVKILEKSKIQEVADFERVSFDPCPI